MTEAHGLNYSCDYAVPASHQNGNRCIMHSPRADPLKSEIWPWHSALQDPRSCFPCIWTVSAECAEELPAKEQTAGDSSSEVKKSTAQRHVEHWRGPRHWRAMLVLGKQRAPERACT
ncbi:hypothetical protein NDU88_002960 [Pleurodeles waltl]|uniref:Uncharacterized protein n=1 Tax=Pleurodeles waltl TaxID=8319 RepID=A0AAV7SD62_PLEWA|nr:hypothetical protein NDU88_002960 [Pleurodeles waltl]